MTRIAIYGAGGLGREIAWMLKDMNRSGASWDIAGFFDDGKPARSQVDRLPVLGGLKELNDSGGSCQVVLAIADPQIKKTVAGSISPAIEFPVIIHHTCQAGDPDTNRFGRGTILTAGVILTTNIRLGDFVLVNLLSTIGHDARIGSFSTIMPGCSISGNVEIGASCLMGTGARTLQNISIGSGTTIGAGAVVTKSFGEGSKLIGVPARAVESGARSQ